MNQGLPNITLEPTGLSVALGGMEMSQWLWRSIHDLFDSDEDIFPAIRIDFSDTRASVSAYGILRDRAERITTEAAYFWCKSRNEQRALDSVPNPAALVASSEAEPFHVVLSGIRSQTGKVPDLGVFVFPGQLVLDYRPGPIWGPVELESLLKLLADLMTLDDEATLTFKNGIPAKRVDRFQEVWKRWLSQRAA